MADRTVSVELVLKTDQYKAEAEAAKLKTEALDRTVVELDRDINKIPADATKAGAALDLMGAGAKKAGDDTGKLDARIAELKDSIKGLGAEFDKTGDPALLKKFRADSSELAGLTKMRKEFEDARPKLQELNNEADRGSGIWSKLTGWIGAGRQALLDFGGKGGTGAQVEGPFAGGLTSPVALGVGAAAAVPALAAVGGAIGAIGGVAGAGLGVAGAVMGNPEEFKAAWGAATGAVKKDLIDAGAAFAGPTMDAIKSIGPTIGSWHLKEALAPAVQYVPELVRGVEGFATGVERGFADLVANAGPEVQALSDGMVQLGDAVGTAFSSIASGAQGGAQALHDTITIVSDLVIAIGAVTGASEKAFGFIHDHPIMSALMTGGLSLGITAWDQLAGATDKAGKSVADTGNAAAEASGKMDDFGKVGGDALYLIDQRARDTLDMVQRMEKSFDEAANAELRFRNASVASAQGLADLEKGWKHVKNALDINTQAGRDNVTLIDKVITESVKQRDAAIAAGGGTKAAYDQANAVYRQQLMNLEAVLIKLGLSKKAADDYLNAFKDKTITITVKVNQVGSVTQQGVISGGVPVRGAFAEGGDPPPGLAWVGEKGPELVRFNGSEHVYTSSQSRAMMAASAPSSSSGGSSGPMQLTYSGSTAGLAGLFLGWIAEESRKGNFQIHSKSVIA